MGRPKTYKRTQALSEAADIFWQTGFSGTSMRTLVAATGVSPKSLYAEFGDKEQLFVSTIQGYIAEHASYYEPLKDGPFGVERLREHFDGYRFNEKFRGCLLVNSLAENAKIPAAAQQRIDAFFRSVKKLFERHLLAARDAGTISAGMSPSALSEALLVFDQGLAIAGRSGAQRPHLRSAVAAFFDAMAPP